MADDDAPTQEDPAQDALDETRFDQEPFDDVHAALAGLPHLDPARDVTPDEPMPDWAWERVSLALAQEASVRAVATHDNVVALPTAAAASSGGGRHSRATRWGGGLVAASVTLIAVGVGYSALQGTAPRPSVVAGNKIAPAAAAPLTPSVQPVVSASAQAFMAASEPTAEDAAAAGAAPAVTPPAEVAATPEAAPPSAQTRSSVVQAARVVTDSGKAYQHEQLPDQVTQLLETVGVQDSGDIAAVPLATALPNDAGFTESWPELRDCITWLTSDADAQAVVVDRGTYEGAAAGVVVAPAAPAPDPGSPAPTMSLDTAGGRLNVWVIDPSCDHVKSSIEDQLVLELQP